jgi:hypothetical protein
MFSKVQKTFSIILNTLAKFCSVQEMVFENKLKKSFEKTVNFAFLRKLPLNIDFLSLAISHLDHFHRTSVQKIDAMNEK